MSKASQPRIAIIGAGPCGLGAAWRLTELGYDSWQLFEKNAYPGGLAASFRDEQGFLWDIGGHVQFSHYDYFDHLMDDLLGNAWLTHERESWIWIRERFVPYPFQFNLKFLPREDQWRCIQALLERPAETTEPAHFEAWIRQQFGDGIAELFMLPYNHKVWAYPPDQLSHQWTSERVAPMDFARVLGNIVLDHVDVGWGPNHTFRYPAEGGTGAIWRRLFERLDPHKTQLNKLLRRIDTTHKTLQFADGDSVGYDQLITTLPLDQLVRMSDLAQQAPASQLVHSSTHVFGVGLLGQPPAHLEGKCWMYFPEDNCPFYRATVFSHYSPDHVPDPERHWSLMLEVADSPARPFTPRDRWEDVVIGLLNTGLIDSADQIVDRFHHVEPYGYPTPSLEREQGLTLLPLLEERDIYSRGRFGAWKYEASNQDHVLMQGVELVNRLLQGTPELTLWHPERINGQ